MLCLNFNNFLHSISVLLADKAKMEKFLPYEFVWTDSTGSALLVEGNSCVKLLQSISFSSSNSTLDIHVTRAL